MNDFYFGCFGEVGHYLWAPGPRHTHQRAHGFPADFPIRIESLDAGLLGYQNPNGPEGQAVLTWIGKPNWTILSFWDRSVDHRGACNSNFIMRGKLEFADALAHAREVWPMIFKRFTFPIVEKEWR